jgi:hypothetical protein
VRLDPDGAVSLMFAASESDTLYQDSLAVLRLEYEVEEMQK